MDQVTVVSVPAPCEFASANDRRHWAHQARVVKQWREAAAWAFKAAKIQPFTQQVHITAVIHKPHGRRYDAANFYPTCKACVDGGTDAGVWVDDDNDHVIGPDMRRGAPDKVNPRLTLEIRVVEHHAAQMPAVAHGDPEPAYAVHRCSGECPPSPSSQCATCRQFFTTGAWGGPPMTDEQKTRIGWTR